MNEFDSLTDLGMTLDKHVICNSRRFIQANNGIRDLCKRYIKNGQRMYDAIKRYDTIKLYTSKGQEGIPGGTLRTIAPFLKASGATDLGVYGSLRESMVLSPGSKEAVNHVFLTMPIRIMAETYVHEAMLLSDELDVPLSRIKHADVNFDEMDIGKDDCAVLRELASKMASLNASDVKYVPNEKSRLDDKDVALLDVMNNIFDDSYISSDVFSITESIESMDSNVKSIDLLDRRRALGLDLEDAAYIGCNHSDGPSMLTVHGNGGLALAFNGDYTAVRCSTVATFSRDATTALILLQEFYTYGTEAVKDLASNWSRDYLKRYDFFNPSLMKTFLEGNTKLPEVILLDDANREEACQRADEIQRKMDRSFARH